MGIFKGRYIPNVPAKEDIMDFKRNKGFTLIEMVVVLAVVAILAAILVPTISQNINDAKVTRATNEAQVIAAAISSFFKDLGRWPTSNGTTGNPDAIRLLYGPGDTPSLSAVTTAGYWLNTGGWTAPNLDTFANQLLENDPKDASVDYDDNTTTPLPEFRWKGPYLIEAKKDPWSCHYSCNIMYTYDTTSNAVGVWSAGPDRTADTPTTQAASTFSLGNDDVIARIQ